MAKFWKWLGSVVDTFGGSDRQGQSDAAAPERTGVEVLGAEFAAAQAALQERRAEDVVVPLQRTVDGLGIIAASAWSLLGAAHEQLGNGTRSADAYKQAAKEYKAARTRPDADQALAIATALVGAGHRRQALKLLSDTSSAYPERADLLAQLATQLEVTEDRAGAAATQARRAALLPPTERVAALRKAVELEPGDYRYRALLGDALLDIDDPVAAADVLAQAAAAAPDDNDVVAALSEALMRCGDVDAAFERANAVLARDPAHTRGLIVRARVLSGRGQHDAATDDVERVLGAKPADVGAHAARFEIRLAAGSTDDLLSDIEAVAGADPGRAAEMANAAAVRGLPDVASRAYDLLVSEWPGEARAWFGRGRLRYAMGASITAAEDLERAAEKAEAAGAVGLQAESLAWLGEIRRRSGDTDGALEVLDRSLALQPGSAFALGCRGRVHAARQERGAAIEDMRAALDADSELWWIHLDLAEQHRLAGDLDAALADLDAAERAGDDSAFQHGTRGQIAWVRGDTKQAITSLRAAFERERQPWIVSELADVLLATAQTTAEFEEALEVVNAGLAESPGTDLLLRTKGEVLRLLGRVDKALAATDRYLRTSPQDATALATRAHLLVDAGKAEEAVGLVRARWGDDLSNLFARSAEVRALSALDRESDALRLLDRLREHYPVDVWLQQMRVAILANLRRLDEALEAAAGQLAVNPRNRWMNGCAGFCQRRLDPPDLPAAVQHLRAADEGEPPDIGIKVELADALTALGDPAATALYERVLELTTGLERRDAWTTGIRAWACLRLDRFEEAVAGFESAVRVEPERIPERFSLALSLLRAGRGELSLDEYEDAIAKAKSHSDAARAAVIVEESIVDLRDVMRLGAAGDDAASESDARRAEALLVAARERLLAAANSPAPAREAMSDVS